RKRRNRGKEGQINVRILESCDFTRHRDAKSLPQPDDFSQVTPLQSRVSIHSSHDLPARFLDEEPRYGAANRTQTNLHHSHTVHSLPRKHYFGGGYYRGMETVLSQWHTARTSRPSLLVMYAYETVWRSVASFLSCVNPVYLPPTLPPRPSH